jgi:hypothetical protein
MAGFADQVKKWEKKTADKLDTAPRLIAFELFSKIVKKTPVDTGRARSNWQPSIGSPISGVLDSVDQSGSATIAQIGMIVANMKAGDTIYLANNLPYIRKLEEGGYMAGPKVVNGYSSQAPAGMVALTVQEFQSIVAAIGIELSFT